MPTLLHMDEKLRLPIGWWVVITWGVFVASFPTALAFSVDSLKLLLLGCGVVGFVGGISAIRSKGPWPHLIQWSLLFLVIAYVGFWVSLVDKILAGETEKTILQALARVWQMTIMSLEATNRHGGLLGALATIYRELLMPMLQVIGVGILIAWNLQAKQGPSTH